MCNYTINKQDIKEAKQNYIHSWKKSYKLYGNYYADDLIENKKLPNNLEIQGRYMAKFLTNYNNKFNKIYIISFYVIILNIIFFPKCIKCCHKKIEIASSYINLKTKGIGYINIFSKNFNDTYPTIITINNIINKTNNEITFKYNFNESINNITLIWDIPPGSTNNLFRECINITEIDLSFIDASSVTTMESMFYGCSS